MICVQRIVADEGRMKPTKGSGGLRRGAFSALRARGVIISEAVLKPEGGLRVKLKQRVNATAQAKLAMDAVLA